MEELKSHQTELLDIAFSQKALEMEEPHTWVDALKQLGYTNVDARECMITGMELFLAEPQHHKTQIIAGAGTGGIFYATLLAHRLQMPCVLISEGCSIEGVPSRGTLLDVPVLLIKDVPSGNPDAVQAIRRVGGIVERSISLFSYTPRFTDSPVVGSYQAVIDYDALVLYARTHRYITNDQKEKLLRWRMNRI